MIGSNDDLIWPPEFIFEKHIILQMPRQIWQVRQIQHEYVEYLKTGDLYPGDFGENGKHLKETLDNGNSAYYF